MNWIVYELGPQDRQGTFGNRRTLYQKQGPGGILVVQWLGPHTSAEGGMGLPPFGELRSPARSMAQPRNKQNKNQPNNSEKNRHLDISPRGWGAAPSLPADWFKFLICVFYIIFVPSSKGCLVMWQMEQNFLTGVAGRWVCTHTHTHTLLDHLISLPPTTRGDPAIMFGCLAPTAGSLKGGVFLLLAPHGLSVESQADSLFYGCFFPIIKWLSMCLAQNLKPHKA